MDQPELEKGAGPIGVIAAPTRELAEQIHKEARKLAKPYNLRICAAFGGLSKYEQFKDLKGGSEVPRSHFQHSLLSNLSISFEAVLVNRGQILAGSSILLVWHPALSQGSLPICTL